MYTAERRSHGRTLFFCRERADVGISDPAVLEERCSLNVDVIETEISDHADRRRICMSVEYRPLVELVALFAVMPKYTGCTTEY